MESQTEMWEKLKSVAYIDATSGSITPHLFHLIGYRQHLAQTILEKKNPHLETEMEYLEYVNDQIKKLLVL